MSIYSVVDDVNKNLYIFNRISSNEFSFKQELALPVGFIPQVGQLSKDDHYYIFAAYYGASYPRLYQLYRDNTSDTFSIETISEVTVIDDIADSLTRKHHPTVSSNLEWIVFAESLDGWLSNDLFIAHKGEVMSVLEPVMNESTNLVFPNPASTHTSIKLQSTDQPYNVLIYTTAGVLLKSQVVTPVADRIWVSTELIPNGVYFYKVISDSGRGDMIDGSFVVQH